VAAVTDWTSQAGGPIKDANHKRTIVDFAAPRFMQYYNDPKRPSAHYRTLGRANAGLSSHRRVVVSTFKTIDGMNRLADRGW
jgi:hypothetical protein